MPSVSVTWYPQLTKMEFIKVKFRELSGHNLETWYFYLCFVRQAWVRISAQHPREDPPTEPAAMKKWRRASANVQNAWLFELYELQQKNEYTKRVAKGHLTFKSLQIFVPITSKNTPSCLPSTVQCTLPLYTSAHKIHTVHKALVLRWRRGERPLITVQK